MSLLIRRLTYKDLESFPNDGRRYEVVHGELHVTAAPDPAHQKLLGLLFVLVNSYVRARRLGEVFFAPLDVRLPDGDLVQPDLVFIRRDRLTRFEAGKFVGPPDLVVEVLSPSTRIYDETVKADRYAGAGIPEYWLADPFERTFRLLVLREGAYHAIEPDAQGHYHSTVLSGLAIDPAALFADLDL